MPVPTTTSPSRSAPSELIARVSRGAAPHPPALAERNADLCGDIVTGPGSAQGDPQRPDEMAIWARPNSACCVSSWSTRAGCFSAVTSSSIQRVGQDDVDIELRTVDVHIRRLRKALNGEGDADIIRTVRSAGYALDSGKSS
jgi:hypothetical protein